MIGFIYQILTNLQSSPKDMMTSATLEKIGMKIKAIYWEDSTAKLLEVATKASDVIGLKNA